MLKALALYFKIKQICKTKKHCPVNRKRPKRKVIKKMKDPRVENIEGTLCPPIL